MSRELSKLHFESYVIFMHKRILLLGTTIYEIKFHWSCEEFGFKFGELAIINSMYVGLSKSSKLIRSGECNYVLYSGMLLL